MYYHSQLDYDGLYALKQISESDGKLLSKWQHAVIFKWGLFICYAVILRWRHAFNFVGKTLENGAAETFLVVLSNTFYSVNERIVRPVILAGSCAAALWVDLAAFSYSFVVVEEKK